MPSYVQQHCSAPAHVTFLALGNQICAGVRHQPSPERGAAPHELVYTSTEFRKIRVLSVDEGIDCFQPIRRLLHIELRKLRYKRGILAVQLELPKPHKLVREDAPLHHSLHKRSQEGPAIASSYRHSHRRRFFLGALAFKELEEPSGRMSRGEATAEPREG